MVKIHAQYINKVAKIFKEEAPHVQFHLCSDNLSAGPETISAWCGVDVRLSDAAVDGHMHMPYYAGTRFFDDVQFNIQSLKKPFFPLIDPAEYLLSFYQQYTPDKVRQNILAVAALGGKGIGFWPGDAFSGEYHKVISEAYGTISAHEDFYADGKRCEGDYTFIPVNTVTKKLQNAQGRETILYFPDFPRVLRTTVHRLGKEELFTLFNYHDNQPMIVEITGKDQRFYTEIPPNGVTVFRSGQLPEQAILSQRAEEFRKKSTLNEVPELRRGKSVLEWCAGPKGEPLFRLGNGKIQAHVNVLGDGRIEELFNASHNELLNAGFLSRLMFYDSSQQPINWKLAPLKIENNIPEIRLNGTVSAYAGANPQENPLLGLELSLVYALEGETLRIEFSLHNPGARPMKIGFRFNNYPMPGARFGAEKVQTLIRSNGKTLQVDPLHDKFVRPGRQTPFFGRAKTQIWDGSAIDISAKKGHLLDELRIIPDDSFAGLYCWPGEKGQTAELLSPEFNLHPGDSKAFRFRVELAPREKIIMPSPIQ